MYTQRPLIIFIITAFIYALFLFYCLFCYPDTLSWTPNADTSVRYKVHVGTSHRNYDRVIDVGTSTSWILDITETGEYYFAVTAYLINSTESAYSYEIFYTISLKPPENFKIMP